MKWSGIVECDGEEKWWSEVVDWSGIVECDGEGK